MHCHQEKPFSNNELFLNLHLKKVALIGNPNVGKSQIFNLLTNSKQLVGNFPGVTVSVAHGIFMNKNNKNLGEIFDLPGSYSLAHTNQAETLTRNWLIENNADLIVNVIDSSNLERNLFLTLILMEIGRPLVIILNMVDIAHGKGTIINTEALEKELQIPVFPLIATKKTAKIELIEWISSKIENPPEIPSIPCYSPQILTHITNLKSYFNFNSPKTTWFATRILEGDTDLINSLDKLNIDEEMQFSLYSQSSNLLEDIIAFNEEFNDKDEIFYKERYKIIRNIIQKVITRNPRKTSLTRHLDTVLTDKFFGIPIFIFILWSMFQFTFEISQPFVEYINLIIFSLSELVSYLTGFIPFGIILNSFINDGILVGVGTVLSFLPTILLLFIAISILEDSGYLARGAFIIDKFMVQFGLEGRSFVPMILGFGCNIPGVMSTRNIVGKRERLLTIMILPFMSCSARLPVFILFGSIFFIHHTSALVLFLYLFGVTIGLLVTLIFKLLLKKEKFYITPLILELPSYMTPSLSNARKKATLQGKHFVKKITDIILFGSIAIWIVSHISLNPIGFDVLNSDYSNTILFFIGKNLQPIFEPLGFNWQLVIALLLGLMAKEVIIATLGVIYLGSGAIISNLPQILSNDPSLSPLVIFTFLVFILLYIPCLPTVGIIKSETNKKLAIFSIVYTFLVAYSVSWILYNIGSILL